MMNRMLASAAACAFVLASGASLAGGNPAAARDKVQQVCAACHGEDGNKPNTPDTPKLGGQHADYLAKALRDYQSGARKNPIMGAMVGGLSEQEIRDLAAYFAQQKSELYTRY
ncbi:MAG TPA: cytochrome c [Burkholderiales bacterium]|jgi:cytochrome c553|nr:cytochrome c [Burkholderiales bacterium]